MRMPIAHCNLPGSGLRSMYALAVAHLPMYGVRTARD